MRAQLTSTAKFSCAGSATKDSQPGPFVFIPKGLCEKLVGGHLQSGNKNISFLWRKLNISH